MSYVGDPIQDIRVSSLCIAFCMESETLRPFLEWASKGHKEHNPGCSDPKCLFNKVPDREERWNHVLIQARLFLDDLFEAATNP